MFSKLKNKQKKTLVFSVFYMVSKQSDPPRRSAAFYQISGSNRQISPVRRVAFMSISR